jgi:hypothetical protein
MDKDALCDAWCEYMPENYDDLSKEEQMKIYEKFEQDFCEGMLAQAEAREDR